MNCTEFLSLIKSRNVKITPPARQNQINLLNAALQQRRYAILPKPILDLYNAVGSLNLGNGYIFGPNEIDRINQYPIPSILKVNDDISRYGKTVGKTVFGRNDLFWFAFDTFGNFYMLDNLTLNSLRKYDDAYKCMFDCLIAGKF